MLGNLNGPTLIVILFVVLLLFGAPKLPALARSLGQSMKILKKEVTPEAKDSNSASDAAGSADGGTDQAPAESASESPSKNVSE